MMKWVVSVLALMLIGCSSADNEMVGGNAMAVNHTVHAINWFSVNGYRVHGGGGRSCCVVIPSKWRPGLKVHLEWEVDPEPFAKIKRKTTGFGFDDEAWAKHEANFRRHKASVDIPEWPGTESCDLKVHFLVCNQVKVTVACALYGQENYPIKEPKQMKEPSVCP
ncbi:DUF3304 domain-containing protein [Pseudomonas fluorescens]|uniref:DUF3304 domain-containing protein n=1 Tax=Pseudomonas fluorescens TaxID=294 RepID=UPI003F957E49